MTRARATAAPPSAYGRRLRDSSSRHHHHHIRQHQPDKTTDAKRGHFKPSRRGQRKPSFSPSPSATSTAATGYADHASKAHDGARTWFGWAILAYNLDTLATRTA
jgi:hypothetical protein